jgi:hypothetical protein
MIPAKFVGNRGLTWSKATSISEGGKKANLSDCIFFHKFWHK